MRLDCSMLLLLPLAASLSLVGCGDATNDATDSQQATALTANGAIYSKDENVLTCGLSYWSADYSQHLYQEVIHSTVASLVTAGDNGLIGSFGPFGLQLTWDPTQVGTSSDDLPLNAYLFNEDLSAYTYVALPNLTMPTTPSRSLLRMFSSVSPAAQLTDGDAGSADYSQVYGICQISPKGTASTTPSFETPSSTRR